MSITALPTPPSRSVPSTFSALADAFLGALPTFVTEANDTAEAMNLNDTTSTSTTSLLIEVASKSLTVDVSKSYQPGMSVKIARTAAPSNWMHGDVTTYNAGTGALVVNVTSILGSGTFTDWTITFSAPAGASGIDATTKMLFYMDTAPTGWTIDNTLDDKVVFVTKGSAAGGQTGGGVHSTGTWTQPNHVHAGPSHTHTTAAMTLATTQIPAHTHPLRIVGTGAAGDRIVGADLTDPTTTGSTGGGLSHEHGATGSGGTGDTGNGATANTWRPAAYCMIICSKN